MSQQFETQSFFNRDAKNWNIASQKINSTISERNNSVIDVFQRRKGLDRFLDVGCGTGQLAFSLAGLGANCVGIDFAREMIEIAVANAKAADAHVEFSCVSVFDFPATSHSFDLVSAQGFIEYISDEELSRFIEFLGNVVAPNGCAVIGSRNRLFNLVSMNEYTRLETELGTIEQLAAESELIQSAKSADVLFEQLNELNLELVRPSTHPHTGIDVATRNQYSPSELITRFKSVNLFPEQIYPINYQPFPQSMLNNSKLLELKNQLSTLISSEFQKNYQFVPYCSSFVISFLKNSIS